jgi:hypothetical protein
MTHLTKQLASILILLAITRTAIASIPYLTDSADITDYKSLEVYLYSTYDKETGMENFQTPVLELDWGVVPNFELDLSIPYIGFVPNNVNEVWGVGDMTTEAKYRVVKETAILPEISIAPSYVWATGTQSYSFFNPGRQSLTLPIWLQKSIGSWTVSTGGGYVLSSADDTKNYPIAGLLITYEFTKKLFLGSELFYTGPANDSAHNTMFFDAGLVYSIFKNFDLTCGVGHSIVGDQTLFASAGVHLTLW